MLVIRFLCSKSSLKTTLLLVILLVFVLIYFEKVLATAIKTFVKYGKESFCIKKF